ncbi:HNH endonuclease [Rhodococcus sp. FXJ9.536]|uniref:HNH endonuclease n=1 Tax=Rhodococcus tibetensis TaxID=2965064 RepID=A0ABT1QC75_9NOCA|nr:HNH endonuclease [Rhodococcus sp. FXJ9.536]
MPPKVCNKCRGRVRAGQRCPTCRPAWQGSSYSGGSTRRGRLLAKQQLEDHPICQAPGCRRLASQVDHIVNLASGGDRYDRANLQSLCGPHHEAKTLAEARAGRRRRTADDDPAPF